MLHTFTLYFLIILYTVGLDIPNISAVEHKVIVEDKKSQIIEYFKNISNNRFDSSKINTSGIILNLLKIYFKISVFIFVVWTILMTLQFNSFLEGVNEGLRFAIFWPLVLLIFIIAEIYGLGPF